MSDDFDDGPQTGSEAFDRVEALVSHPGDGDLFVHDEAKIAVGISPEDGLPQIRSDPWQQHLAPALSPATLLCMEDSQKFVLRDSGRRVVAEFSPEDVRWLDDGRAVVDRTAALAKIQRKTVRTLLGFAVMALRQGTEVEVEPIRPQCRHYVRQMMDFPDQPEHQMVLRMCTAKRSDSGEYESVRETLVFACELREPRADDTSRILRKFDEAKIAAARARGAKMDYRFDLAAALRSDERAPTPKRSDPLPDITGGGIFRGPGLS